MIEPLSYEEWMMEVRRVAREELGWSAIALASIDNESEGWRDYYEAGETPRTAWSEEYEAQA